MFLRRKASFLTLRDRGLTILDSIFSTPDPPNLPRSLDSLLDLLISDISSRSPEFTTHFIEQHCLQKLITLLLGNQSFRLDILRFTAGFLDVVEPMILSQQSIRNPIMALIKKLHDEESEDGIEVVTTLVSRLYISPELWLLYSTSAGLEGSKKNDGSIILLDYLFKYLHLSSRTGDFARYALLSLLSLPEKSIHDYVSANLNLSDTIILALQSSVRIEGETTMSLKFLTFLESVYTKAQSPDFKQEINRVFKDVYLPTICQGLVGYEYELQTLSALLAIVSGVKLPTFIQEVITLFFDESGIDDSFTSNKDDTEKGIEIKDLFLTEFRNVNRMASASAYKILSTFMIRFPCFDKVMCSQFPTNIVIPKSLVDKVQKRVEKLIKALVSDRDLEEVMKGSNMQYVMSVFSSLERVYPPSNIIVPVPGPKPEKKEGQEAKFEQSIKEVFLTLSREAYIQLFTAQSQEFFDVGFSFNKTFNETLIYFASTPNPYPILYFLASDLLDPSLPSLYNRLLVYLDQIRAKRQKFENSFDVQFETARQRMNDGRRESQYLKGGEPDYYENVVLLCELVERLSCVYFRHCIEGYFDIRY